MDAWNHEQEIEMGLFRISIPDFNKRAFREALVNAFSHRDYSKMGRVRIAINDDGITIANPGGFIECFLQVQIPEICRQKWRILHLRFGESCRLPGRIA